MDIKASDNTLQGEKLARHILSSEYNITDKTIQDKVIGYLTVNVLSDEWLMRPAIKLVIDLQKF